MKPTKIEVSWCFACPECGSEWWFYKDEMKSGVTLHCCGKVYGYVKLENFKVKYRILDKVRTWRWVPKAKDPMNYVLAQEDRYLVINTKTKEITELDPKSISSCLLYTSPSPRD